MKRKLLRLVDKLFGPTLRLHYGVPSMEGTFRNMRRLGFKPGFIVDIGAFKGEWTVMAREEFPEASVLMLEAQEDRRSLLEEIKSVAGGKIDYRIAVMGANEGETVVFHQYSHAPTAASILEDHEGSATGKVESKLRTLDSVLAAGNFPKPDLIKLDVQGYELEVLRGGNEALRAAEGVLMEVSIIPLYRNNPLLQEVTAFMAEHGFVTYDICSLLRRPLDNALCQVDILFVKESSPLLGAKTWN